MREIELDWTLLGAILVATLALSILGDDFIFRFSVASFQALSKFSLCSDCKPVLPLFNFYDTLEDVILKDDAVVIGTAIWVR